MIEELKKSGEWKIQLTMYVNSISSKDNDVKRLIHLKGDNIPIIFDGKTDEIATELFQSLLTRYRIALERSM